MAHANRKTRRQAGITTKGWVKRTKLGCFKHGKPSGLKKRTDWPVVGPRQNHI
jgi:hypothetical protein